MGFLYFTMPITHVRNREILSQGKHPVIQQLGKRETEAVGFRCQLQQGLHLQKWSQNMKQRKQQC